MRLLVLSSSLDPQSRSRLLARRAYDRLTATEAEIGWLDAAELNLPLCDGGQAWADDDARTLQQELNEADGVLLALGIYNYSASAVAKTIVELGGKSWQDTVVGFLCAAGGHGGYMSVMGLANSLMLDFHCVIVPRFVYATAAAFDEHEIKDKVIMTRIDVLCEAFSKMTAALGKS